jgi:hypothetical protein
MSKLSKFWLHTALFSAAIILLTAPAAAQVLYGTIVGNVTDASKGAVASAQVSITGTLTGRTWQTTSNAEGVYTFNTIPAGIYNVGITAAGFRSFDQKGVEVTANTTVRVNAELQLGGVQEHIEVSAFAAVLQSDTADVRSEVTDKELQNLPMNINGNYESALITVPGFAPPQDSNSLSGNPSRGLMLNMNGTNAASASVQVDGTTAQNVWLPHVAGYVPTLEAIQTVNVVAGSFTAEQGSAGGAAVNVQIKSGTNQIHGSAFEYHIDNHLMAKAYFNPPSETPKRIVNNYGGSFGGPIRKDKIFFFASWEGRRDRENGSAITSVPTALMRTGNMTESATLIYDPATGNLDGTGRTAFPGNIIPTSRISPISAKLMTMMPMPNYGTSSLNNYFASGAFAYNKDILDTKVNYYVNSKLNLTGRVSFMHWDFDQATLFGDLGGTGVDSRGTYPVADGPRWWNVTISAIYTLTSSTIVDAYFGYNLKDDQETLHNQDQQTCTALGIPGTNATGLVNGGWCGFSVSSYPTFGNPYANTPGYWHAPNYQYSANLSKVYGNHNLRFGESIVTGDFATVGPLAYPPAGLFTFGDGPTQLSGKSGNQFNSYATFLLGLPTSIGKDLIPTTPEQVNFSNIGLYGQDRWQAARNLTVSLGLRWDYYPVPSRPGRGLEEYNFQNNQYTICGYQGNSCTMTSSKRQFEPRLGVAYRVSDTFVVRAGYGISYDPINAARNSHQNYPTLTSFSESGVNSYQPVTTFAQGIPAIDPPQLGTGVFPLPANVSVKLLDPNFKRAYVQSWNLALQKQLPGKWIGETAYVGNHTVHTDFQWNANYAAPGGGTSGEVLNKLFGRTAATTLLTDIGGAHYEGWQNSVQRRFSRGYQIKFAYTFSKAIGYGGQSGLDTLSINWPSAFNLNRMVLPFNHTQNFNASGSLELPFGKGKPWVSSGIGAKILGGWQLSGILAAYTGAPFTVSASGTSLNAPGNSQQADQILPNVQTLGSPSGWFNPLAFAPVTQVRFGTAGFDILRGPGVVNLDGSLKRRFQINERFDLTFRMDLLNSTNTPHFANPGANVSNMQVLANGTVQLNGFTQVTSVANTGSDSIGQRFIRVGLRIGF